MNNMNMMNMNMNNMNKDLNTNKSKSYSYPHHSGLENIGQTCYMNSTIQCLSNVKGLSDVLLKNYGNYDYESQPLALAYSNLLYDLFNNKEKSIAPKLFKEIIGLLNPLFKGNHAADSKDLLFFLIETLHKELNNGSNYIQIDCIQIDFNQQEIDSRDENKMLQKFVIDYNLRNSSIVSDCFYGINRSILKCLHCNVTKYSFQVYNLLVFHLKKVKEWKIKQSGKYYDYNLDLYDAFNCEQKEENLEGENMIYCNNCKELRKGINQQNIYGLPKYLIIILNRGKNNQDFNEKFKFPDILDFTGKNIVINNQSYKKYYLCGIITHLGESGSSGHFICYCRCDPNSNDFVLYNDSVVSKVSIKNAMKENISKNDNEKKTPYILFYHHCK